MIGVTNNSPQQINAALISMKNELKREIITETKIESDVIDDTTISTTKTWSSERITSENTEIENKIQGFYVDGSIDNTIDSKDVSTETTSAVITTKDVTIPQSGVYYLRCSVTNVSAGVVSNSLRINLIKPDNSLLLLCYASQTASTSWARNDNSVVVPLKSGVTLRVIESFTTGGFRYYWTIEQIG